MTESTLREEKLLCLSRHREIYSGWQEGEITSAEAFYLARRGEFLYRTLDFGVPRQAIGLVGWIYDFLFERWALR